MQIFSLPIARRGGVWYNEIGKRSRKSFWTEGDVRDMDYANAARFLKSYNKIESQLKLLYHAKATQNFTDLVRRCTDLNLTIRRYENELIDYGKLRNAIVHRTAGGEVFIANPSDDVVENIEYIERQLCNPPRATDVFKVKKISTVFADKPLITAVQTFGESEKKTLVVYDHGKMAGVINSYYLYRLIAAKAEAGESITDYLKNTNCGDILDEKLLKKYLLFDKQATVFDVFDAFERRKDIYAVIITENGVLGEKVLLLLTPSDFPAINRYLEAFNAKPY